MIELALSLLDLRLSLQVLRVLSSGDVGVAVEPGQLDLRLLTQ